MKKSFERPVLTEAETSSEFEAIVRVLSCLSQNTLLSSTLSFFARENSLSKCAAVRTLCPSYPSNFRPCPILIVDVANHVDSNVDHCALGTVSHVFTARRLQRLLE